MTFKESLFYEVGRREAYKGFSECFLPPHDNIDITLKNLEQHLKEVGSSSSPLIEKMRSEFQNQNRMDRLKIDFTRLFIGPYRVLAPPYGSEYLEEMRKIMGDSTVDALEKYHAAGMVPSDDFKDTPDHISMELEFMYFLIYKETEGLVSETATVILEYLNKQKEFVDLHIGHWVEPFAQNIKNHAQTDFYKNLAAGVDIFIKEDVEYLNEIVTRKSEPPFVAMNSQGYLRKERSTIQSL